MLYQFTVSADPAGAIDFDQFSFNVSTSSTNGSDMKVTSLPLRSGEPVDRINTAVGSLTGGSGIVSITPTSIVQIPAGSSKTFLLKASISAWPAGAGISVNLYQADTTLTYQNGYVS